MRSAPFQVSSDTSIEAAQSVTRGTKRITDAGNILAIGQRVGSFGFTASEVQIELNLGPQTVTPRVWELEQAHCLVCTERTRHTPSGKKAHVYEVVPGATIDTYVAWLKQYRPRKKVKLTGATALEIGIGLIKERFPAEGRQPEVQLCLDVLEERAAAEANPEPATYAELPDDFFTD